MCGQETMGNGQPKCEILKSPQKILDKCGYGVKVAAMDLGNHSRSEFHL